MTQNTDNQENNKYINKNYGEKFQDHILQQYKLYVEMMDKVTERRVRTNSFYITLLSSLLTLLSFFVNKDNNISSKDSIFLLFIFSILGISLCYIWYTNINSYKQLNSLKFKVIHEMESHLPFFCYYGEWDILDKNKDKKNKYKRLNNVEKTVPLILSVPYICLLFYSCYSVF